MRNLTLLDQYRDSSPRVLELYGNAGDHESGVFRVPTPGGSSTVLVVASCGEGWEHVSVSLEHRTPSWHEMDHIKRLFFEDNQWAVQYHPAVQDHINCCKTCLHLWRPSDMGFPKPPKHMVA